MSHSSGKTRNISVRFEVLAEVTMKNAVFWDVMPCGACKNRRFGESCIHYQGVKISEMRLQLLVTANGVPSVLIIFTVMKEAICSSEKPIRQFTEEQRGVFLSATYKQTQ
jgi:hypothetical protein